MRKFVFAAAVLAGLGVTTDKSAMAQGCGGAGGMCAAPGAAGQQAMPGMPMQQATPGVPAQQAAPGTGMMGGMSMCACCRQMAMMQPGAQGGMGMMGQGGMRPMPPDGAGGDMGMGSTPRPPVDGQPTPGGAPPVQ